MKILRRLAWGTAALVLALFATSLWLTHRGVISSSDAIPECRSPLSPEIEAKIRPVLAASQGWDWGPNYDALEDLLADTTREGLEARAALSAYYLGAHPSEELHEKLLAQQQQATPLMQHYMECRPPMEKEWLIGTVRAGRGGYKAYFELLRDERSGTAPAR